MKKIVSLATFSVACILPMHSQASEQINGIEVSEAPIAVAEYCPSEWRKSSVLNREEGVVSLLVLVDADGSAADVTLHETSGFRDLDKASAEAVRKCRFVPAKKDGLAVKTWFRLSHHWKAGAFASPITNRPPCEPPAWPREALINNQQGSVTLRFMVEVNGEISAYEIVRSSGYPVLDTAAGAGIAKCWFRPKSEDGKPIKGWQQMEYRWVLN
ncbi:energy transducer TonB [Massilia eburnea]|uniref:energy transducer TonB n=1 Tax=Massilia eburnea TaxID=1776165 RepID=UPI003D6AC3D5